jgi:protein-disulfide isomerase
MTGARACRAPHTRAWCLLALACGLGSVACERPGQAASPETVDASRAAASFPGFEPEVEPELTDADVDHIAVKVPRGRVPAVTNQNPAKGPAGAPVTLQVFSDFECPFCVRVAPTLGDVEQRFQGRIRVVWRNYPLPGHARARPAARAALAVFAAGGSEAFWKFHDWLYGPRGDLSDAGLAAAARQLKLEAADLVQASRSPRYDAQIDADMAAGDAAGIEGTPAVFINDYYVMGARFESEYRVVVERALREAG